MEGQNLRYHETLIASLTPEEAKELVVFAKSPWFNNRKDLERISELIYQSYFLSLKKKKDPQFPTDQQAWKAAYPANPKLNEGTLRACYSKLSDLVERFLVQTELEKQKVLLALGKADVFLRLSEWRELAKAIAEGRKNMDEKDPLFLEYIYKFSVRDYKLKVHDRKRTNDTILPEVLNAHRLYQLREKLVHYVELISYKRILVSNHEDISVAAEINDLTKQDLKAYPVLNGYVLAYKMLLNQNPEDLKPMNDLRDFLMEFDVLKRVPMPDIQRLFNFLQNQSIARVNQELLGAREYHFEIVRKGLTKGFFFEEGLMPHWIFKNIVTNALQVGEVARDWVEAFMKNYEPFLVEKYKSDVLIYCKALIAFYHKEYSKAVLELQKVSQSMDYFLSIDSRILELKIRLIRRDIPGVDSTAKAFDQYLRRIKGEIADDRRQSYIIQNSYFRKIVKLKRLEKAIELKGQLRGEPPFANKNWLLHILNELIQSGKLEE